KARPSSQPAWPRSPCPKRIAPASAQPGAGTCPGARPRDVSRKANESDSDHPFGFSWKRQGRTVLRVARPPRLQAAGGAFHITAGGNRRQPIFNDDRDRERFLRLLTDVIRRSGWRCHAFCLMPNHYHLLIETPEPNLSTGMYRLNGSYAQWFNRRLGLDG